MYYYSAITFPPTAVLSSLRANFTQSNIQELIIAKTLSLEVYSRSDNENLKKRLEIPIAGRISDIHIFSPWKKKTSSSNLEETRRDLDWLVVLTEKKEIIILKFNPNKQTVIEVSSPSSQNFLAMKSVNGLFLDKDFLPLISIYKNIICIQTQANLLKFYVTRVASSKSEAITGESFVCPFQELDVLDIRFLDKYSFPTLAVLYQCRDGKRHFKTYSLDLTKKTIIDGPIFGARLRNAPTLMKMFDFPSEEASLSDFLTFFGGKGVVLFKYEGDKAVRSGKRCGTGQKPSKDLKPVCQVEMNVGGIEDVEFIRQEGNGTISSNIVRFVVVDEFGGFHVVLVSRVKAYDQSEVGSAQFGVREVLTVKSIGSYPLFTSITNLGEGYMFLGSCKTDSSFCKLVVDGETMTIQEKQSFPSLAPIRKVEKYSFGSEKRAFILQCYCLEGESALLAACGDGRSGSLRVIKRAVELEAIETNEEFDVQNMQHVWCGETDRGFGLGRTVLYSSVGDTGQWNIVGIKNERLETGKSRVVCLETVRNELFLITQEAVYVSKLDANLAELRFRNPSSYGSETSQGNLNILSAKKTAHVLFCFIYSEVGKFFQVYCYSEGNGKILGFPCDTNCILFDAHILTGSDKFLLFGCSAELLQVFLYDNIRCEIKLIATAVMIENMSTSFFSNTRKLKSVTDICVTRKSPTSVAVFIGFSDGDVHLYCLDNLSVEQQPLLQMEQSYSIGTHPVKFTLEPQSQLSVAAISSRVFVFYCSENQNSFTRSVIEFRNMTDSSGTYDVTMWNKTLLLHSKKAIALGIYEDLAKLHIKSYPQSKEIISFAVSKPLSSIFMITSNVEPRPGKRTRLLAEKNCVEVLNAKTFESIKQKELEAFEKGLAITCCSLRAPSVRSNFEVASKTPSRVSFSIVGTGFFMEGEPICSAGRLLAFDDKLNSLGEFSLTGVPAQALEQMQTTSLPLLKNEALVAVGGNGDILIFKITLGMTTSLPKINFEKLLANKRNSFVSSIFCTGNHILVGDFYKSISTLEVTTSQKSSVKRVKPEDNLQLYIQETGRNYHHQQVTAAVQVDGLKKYYLIGTGNQEIGVFCRSKDDDPEYQHVLEAVSGYNLGMQVNCFLEDSLMTPVALSSFAPSLNSKQPKIEETVSALSHSTSGEYTTQLDNFSALTRDNLLFATPSGALGVLVALSEAQYKFLSQVVRSTLKNSEALSAEKFTAWRRANSMEDEDTKLENFIDGDVINRFMRETQGNREEVLNIIMEDTSEVFFPKKRNLEETSRNTHRLQEANKLLQQLSTFY
eukprot:snap_masked-scaffold_18-processed-gene-2.21-mRNA-1 protein AED:1.00 eAED:1.00 QI:0/0/0/0/1/1/5/0/1297